MKLKHCWSLVKLVIQFLFKCEASRRNICKEVTAVFFFFLRNLRTFQENKLINSIIFVFLIWLLNHQLFFQMETKQVTMWEFLKMPHCTLGALNTDNFKELHPETVGLINLQFISVITEKRKSFMVCYTCLTPLIISKVIDTSVIAFLIMFSHQCSLNVIGNRI